MSVEGGVTLRQRAENSDKPPKVYYGGGRITALADEVIEIA
jgi:hypothetical protein